MKLKIGTVLITKDEQQNVFVINEIDGNTVYFTNNLGTMGVVGRNAIKIHFTVKT